MELSLVLVYLVPSHQVQVSPFYRWTQRARAMSYLHSTQQQQNNTKAPTTNTIFLLLWKLSNTCFLGGGGTKDLCYVSPESSAFKLIYCSM